MNDTRTAWSVPNHLTSHRFCIRGDVIHAGFESSTAWAGARDDCVDWRAKAAVSDVREDALLRESVSAVTTYFEGDASMGDTLTRIAELAQLAVPDAEFVGLTMLVDDRPGTYIFTHPDVPEIDQDQYDTGDGPCLDCFR